MVVIVFAYVIWLSFSKWCLPKWNIPMLENTEGAANSQQNRTIEVFNSIKKQGLKLNKNKCLFNKSKVIFVGHRITGKGIFPDRWKVEAVIDMPYPTVKELPRLLGMVYYLCKFIPNLSTHTFNLWKLLEKDSLWCSENKHENEVDNMKQLIANSRFEILQTWITN